MGQRLAIKLPEAGGKTMSQQQPEPRESLEVDVPLATVQLTNLGDAKTSLIFTVTDGEWRAYYFFQEQISPAAQQHFALALQGGPFIHSSASNLGAGVLPTTVYPSTPLQVDEFALRPGPSQARLRRLDRGGVIRLNLELTAASGNLERIPLFLKPKKGSELPAPLEYGWVSFHRKELVA
jgi:hypothetical protein